MIVVTYTPAFVKATKALETRTFEIALNKIDKFKDPRNHAALKVHKLHGKLAGKYSFSVDRDFRIVFECTGKDEVIFHAIGRHSIYC